MVFRNRKRHTEHRTWKTTIRQASRALLFSLLIAVYVSAPAAAQDIGGDQGLDDVTRQLVIGNAEQYVPDDGIASGACGATGAPGTLPAIIPEPYNGAFTSGGNKHQVAPALVAAIFTEENFTNTDPAQLAQRWANFPKVHPDPNSGWPTNQYNTMGAFQFIPPTWAAYGDDGDGNGTKDAQNIWDGAAGAANYLAAGGATIDKAPGGPEWQKAIFAYNHAQWYVDAVMKYYNFYISGGTNTATTGQGATAGCAGSTANCQDGGTTVSGKMALLCEARKFDPFGYLWGGGHGDPEQFMQQFNSLGGYTAPFRRVVDCSGLVTVAIWNAYHAKVVFTTDGMASLPQFFRPISVAESQPGDLVWHPGHVEIVAAAGGTATFGAHTDGIANEKQISDDNQPASSWQKAYVYVGPGGTQ